jgi:NAD(P)-dependent dehydrogenase (short-subunit alcohol dehydrogenase family)
LVRRSTTGDPRRDINTNRNNIDLEIHMEQIVIITGASGNLGSATARAFQQRSAKTVLLDRSADRLAKVFPDLSSDHMIVGGFDLTSSEATASLVSDIVRRYGRIDVLVNTIGAWRGGKAVHEGSLDEWDLLFEANLRTTLVACRAVVPRMIPQRFGRIINVASRDALKGGAGYSAYSASKSAVIRLTESLADELKAFDITANCILPSTIDTPQNRGAMPGADFSKWVEPAALADVIFFLSSDGARAVTGAALPVYGKG